MTNRLITCEPPSPSGPSEDLAVATAQHPESTKLSLPPAYTLPDHEPGEAPCSPHNTLMPTTSHLHELDVGLLPQTRGGSLLFRLQSNDHGASFHMLAGFH